VGNARYFCERITSGFWAEPVNAFTNIGFVFSAYFCWRIAVRAQVQDSNIAIITVMILAIGIGSFLFHNHANRCYALVIYLAMRALLVNLSTGSNRWHNR
jgi:hypothetical protein